MSSLALLAIPMLPFLVALGLALSERTVWQRAAPYATVPAFLALLWVTPGDEKLLPWFMLQARVGLDATSQVFLAFSSLLWMAGAVYARDYLKDDPKLRRFLFFFTLSMSGNLGLIVARDMVSFYLFFALMSFAAYGMVVHGGEVRDRRAGRYYLGFVVLGEVALFAALAMLAVQAGDISMAALIGVQPPNEAVALLLLAFAIKMGAVPLHFWLPLAHRAAPTPGSAVLSGAMIKAGLLGGLQFLPFGSVAYEAWGTLLMGVGVFTAFYGAIVGVAQIHAKTVLAYSSVSQMGVITVLLGVALTTPQNWPLLLAVIIVYAAHHALVKGALFLGFGLAGQTSPWWVKVFLLLLALALAGAPLTSGFAAKLSLKEGLADHPLLVTLLSVAAVGTTLLMARFIDLAFHQERAVHAVSRKTTYIWLGLTTIILLYPWLWFLSSGYMIEVVDSKALFSTLWPITAGLIGFGCAFYLLKRFQRLTVVLPEGDVVIWFEHAFSSCSTWLTTELVRLQQVTKKGAGRIEVLIKKTVKTSDGRLAAVLGSWQITGAFFISLIVVLIIAFFLDR